MEKLTQREKVLKIMIKYGSDGRWFSTYQFMQYDDIFIGHRAPARVSELSTEFPELIETDKSDKVYKYRFRFDNLKNSLEKVPIDLKIFIIKTLKSENVKFNIFKLIPEFTENGVRMVQKEVII